MVASVSEGFLLRGIHRILYYFSNDIGNVNRAVAHVTARSYGLNSFEFVTDYLFVTERLRDIYLNELQRQASTYKPAGTWTLFGNPYVDFGWLGLGIVAVLGFVSEAVYQRARESQLVAQIYGLIAAGLILSWHYSLFSTPEMMHNVVVLIIINEAGFIAHSITPRLSQITET
jgi:oligosaccharide repeat unit polymerase